MSDASVAKGVAWLERRFGGVVRELREARGLSQAELARELGALGFEYHQTTIGKLESGARPLRIGELYAMAAVFGVSATDLLDAAAGKDGQGEFRTASALRDREAKAFRDAARQYGGALLEMVAAADRATYLPQDFRDWLDKWLSRITPAQMTLDALLFAKAAVDRGDVEPGEYVDRLLASLKRDEDALAGLREGGAPADPSDIGEMVEPFDDGVPLNIRTRHGEASDSA